MAFALNAAPFNHNDSGVKFDKASLNNVLSNKSVSDIHSQQKEDIGLSDFYASYDAPDIPPPPSELPQMDIEQPGSDTKINYILDLLEQQKDIKTQQKKEEIILYFFLGLFIIYILNSFVEIGKYSR